MSLKIWLPMNRDLRNQGLLNNTITNSGATYSSNGKLGGCYIFDGVDDSLAVGNLSTMVETDFSFACWFYKDEWGSKGYETIFGGPSGFELESKVSSTNSPVLKLYNWGGGSCTYELSKWNHIVFTRNSTETKLYLNGELKVTGSAGTIPNNNYFVGSWNSATQQNFKGKMCDVRIYDHCLSPMEVKELAKGLVLHYPLNRGGLGPSNLLKNGFGELGSENWNSGTNISTSDIPSGQSDIKASFSNGYAIERIKLYPTHTYKFSAWIKATTTSGSTYPSLFPYDVDGKFIDYYKCSDSFNLNTMTTLKQQLKTGDTKIYVNDLSQWNANSGHYYNWAAIFSYTDSTGYTYPDGTYTQNLGRFGSSTNAKTNLDKTNNIITLTTAYTGPNMPVGTKLCASTEWDTYYYPLGGINLANIQDWTYKEGTFSASTARLKYAKEVSFWTCNNNRMAGIKLQDLTNENLDTTIEYDCSGFCNNGTRTGTFTWTSDTPKYSVSQDCIGTNYIHLTPPSTEIQTMAVWVNWKTIPSGQSVILVDNGSGIGLGLYSGGILCSTSGAGSSYAYSKSNLVANTWYHFVVVKTGTTTRKLYINGVEQTATSNSSNWSYSVNQLQLGKRSTTSDGFIGKLSDFRAYATALSASDVKSLYQNCATIDPDGTIRGQIRS